MRTYYALKWVDAKGRGTGGSRPYQYDLPKRGKPGRWHRKHKEAIIVCQNGFHCTNLYGFGSYYEYGPRLFIVEIAGKFSADGEKVAVEAMRFVSEVGIDENLLKLVEDVKTWDYLSAVFDNIVGGIMYETIMNRRNKLQNNGVLMVEYFGGSGLIGREELGKYIPITLESKA